MDWLKGTSAMDCVRRTLGMDWVRGTPVTGDRDSTSEASTAALQEAMNRKTDLQVELGLRPGP